MSNVVFVIYFQILVCYTTILFSFSNYSRMFCPYIRKEDSRFQHIGNKGHLLLQEIGTSYTLPTHTYIYIHFKKVVDVWNTVSILIVHRRASCNHNIVYMANMRVMVVSIVKLKHQQHILLLLVMIHSFKHMGIESWHT